jgi:hypothetical protein
METKRVEIQIDVSHDYNPNWRKLWDILLRPPEEKPSSDDGKPATATEKLSAMPEKHRKSKPEQLSLFTLDNSKPERDDPSTEQIQEA